MQRPDQAPPPTFSNHSQSQSQSQQPAVQAMQQPTPMQFNNFTGQRPFAGQLGATPPSISQQPPMQQQAIESQSPYGPNGHMPPQPMNVQPMQQALPGQQQYQPMFQQPMQQFPLAPPQAQGRPAAALSSDGQSAAVVGSDTGAGVRSSRRVPRQSPFGNRNLWVDGRSVVGRKGKDGEWEEVRCSVM